MTNIVIVDDDPGVLEAFRYVFDPVKYQVTIFLNGTAILDNECPIPDIYLLDKQLSGVDGLDICRFLKGQHQTRHIPVIIMTASPNIFLLAQSAGADGILEKPFDVGKLRNMVNSHVHK